MSSTQQNQAVDETAIDSTRQPIVVIRDGEAVADSRDVAAYFGKEHKRVLQTIRELQCSDDFRRHHFVPFKINDLSGESTSHVMMTRDGFMFLVMGFTGGKAAAFKESYIAQFNAMEAELRRQSSKIDVRDQNQLTTIALQLIEVKRELEARVSELEPKAEALDRIADTAGSFSVTEAAKTLQVQPSVLFRYLRTHGWVYRRPGASCDLAYQSHLANGDLEHKTTTVLRADGSEKTVTQVRVTPRGLTKLAKLLQPVASIVKA